MGRSIRLSTTQGRKLSRLAAAAYPEECCGFLVGKRLGAAVRVEAVWATENRATDRTRRYEIAPEALIAAHVRAHQAGAQVVGYYHSHPGSPAIPSTSDRAAAWPDVSYLIVPLEQGAPGPLRSWSLRADGEFSEEVVRIE